MDYSWVWLLNDLQHAHTCISILFEQFVSGEGKGGTFPYLKMVGNFPMIDTPLFTFSNPIVGLILWLSSIPLTPLSAEKNWVSSIPFSYITKIIEPNVVLNFLPKYHFILNFSLIFDLVDFLFHFLILTPHFYKTLDPIGCIFSLCKKWPYLSSVTGFSSKLISNLSEHPTLL